MRDCDVQRLQDGLLRKMSRGRSDGDNTVMNLDEDGRKMMERG